MTDLATLSITRTGSRYVITNESEGIRQMADTKKAQALAIILAKVEKIRAKYGKELQEIREKALENEQLCSKMMTYCRKVAISADKKAQGLEDSMTSVADIIMEFQKRWAPTQPPAKKKD